MVMQYQPCCILSAVVIVYHIDNDIEEEREEIFTPYILFTSP